jgi:TPR repeat protein
MTDDRDFSRAGRLIAALLACAAGQGLAAETSTAPGDEPEFTETGRTADGETVFKVPFPGFQDDPAYQSTQKLFDGYWRRGRHAEAHRGAVKGLVWRGDKHAQYMVGYMYHEGTGVAHDRVRACALPTETGRRTRPRCASMRYSRPPVPGGRACSSVSR